jgi:peptidoglycan lytic transglycosylase
MSLPLNIAGRFFPLRISALKRLLFLWIVIALFATPLQLPLANELPKILNNKDAKLYQQIFQLQENGNWRKSDKLIKQLKDPLLMGHVQYQRYMHPTLYRAKYSELHLWMKAYADHPGAEKLYRLAVSRHRSDWKATPRPTKTRYLGGTGPGQPFYRSRPYKSRAKRNTQTRNDVAHAKRVVRRYLFRGQPTNASEYLELRKTQSLLDRTEKGILQEKVALSFFLYGKDEDAVKYANLALKNGRRYTPLANWTAGLASWRQNKLKQAVTYFSTLATTKKVTGWTASRASWWASRTYFKMGKPEQALNSLRQAAGYPRTFYGVLALRQLGVLKPFSWERPELSVKDIKWLEKSKAARRAIALSEAGQFHLAERELRTAFPSAKSNRASMLISLSQQIGAPSVAMRMGLYMWEYKKSILDTAIYPIPMWKPANGFKLDRALIYAFMRQESGFNARAKSPVGAKGLMQLMPRTASYLANDKSLLKRKSRKLFDPSYNLGLGQQYLQTLMRDKTVGTNLFNLTIAYNGGPGNLVKWKKRVRGSDDPLFFIEAMQSRETRSFIKRVLTNFWIYRHQLGQDLPALDELAEGRWPNYYSLDTVKGKVAKHARN